MAAIVSKAPGRICLFGDHQDYLGLPVIACAIDRYVWVKGAPNNKSHFKIAMPDLDETLIIECEHQQHGVKKGEHLKAALEVAKRYGCDPRSGFDVIIQGDVPINAGLSSSSAMVVAWMQWLFTTFGCEHEVTPAFLGQVAYEAEVVEQNSPGGKMDQFTSALGEIIYLETAGNESFLKLQADLGRLIIGESGIPKDTLGLLEDLKCYAQKAISIIGEHHPEFDILKCGLEAYEMFKELLPENLRPYFFAALKNYSITREAYTEFQKAQPELKKIGELMNAHHKVLRDILQTTVPLIDKMVDAALLAGAFGVKIVGSGGGGSIVALAQDQNEKEIIEAIKRAGALKAYSVNISPGAHIKND
ncbi:MAG: galactokinase [Flavobacterium sp.]|nr:MAG: galactokinase [Flavobacterium sp.]